MPCFVPARCGPSTEALHGGAVSRRGRVVRRAGALFSMVAVGAVAGVVGVARAEAGTNSIQAPLPAGLTGLSNSAVPAEASVNDVSCPSADWCVAVGEYDGEAHQIGNGGFIDTLSGGLWTSLSPPSPSDSTTPSSAQLLSVSCWAVGSCVAVGDYDGTERGAGLVETLSNGTWAASTVPLPANGLTTTGFTSPLWGVSCTADGTCVAVGQYETTFLDSHASSYPAGEGLVETLPSGSSTWSATEVLDPNGDMPQGGGYDNGTTLHAVSCSSDTSCTAVGSFGEFDGYSGQVNPWIATLSSGVWSGMEPSVPANAFTTYNDSPNLDAELLGVSCVSDGFCVAVGQYNVAVPMGSQTGSALVPLVETLPSGGGWTATEGTLPSNASAPANELDDQLVGVDCLADGSCDAAGFYAPTAAPYQAFVSALGNGSWTPTEMPAPSDSTGGSNAGVYGGISCAVQASDNPELGGSPACVLGGEYTAKVVGCCASDVTEGFLTRETEQAGAIDQVAPLSGTVAPGTAFAGQLAVTGQYGAVAFTQSTGSPSLTVSASGAVSGAGTLTAGVYTATGSDSDPIGDGGTWSFQLTVGAPVSVTTVSLPDWTVAQPGYDETVVATGGAGALTFAVGAGSLPTGLHLSTSGVMSGTPTAAGSFTFTVTASDTGGQSGSQSYTITINPAVTITTATLPSGTQTESYDETIAATGGTGLLTFSKTSGTLPPGLALSSAGVLSGTPTALGQLSFTVEASDTVGATATRSYTVAIVPPPTITSFSPGDGGVRATVTLTGTNLSAATQVKVGTTSAAFAVVSDTTITFTIPVGATTGHIQVTTPSGTATSSGTLTVLPPPTITSISPGSGPIGATITITGTNLQDAIAIRIGTIIVVPTSIALDGSLLTFTVPAGAVTGVLEVIAPNGSVTSTDTLTITA